MMQVQYHDIKEGETWKGMNYQTVLSPAETKTGEPDLPYEKAK
jgi:branched-chain amino acid transport system substrate-binding protein